jgi:hypothetical protein
MLILCSFNKGILENSSYLGMGFCCGTFLVTKMGRRRGQAWERSMSTRQDRHRRRGGVVAARCCLGWSLLSGYNVQPMELCATATPWERTTSPWLHHAARDVVTGTDQSLPSPFPESDMPTLPPPDGAAIVPDLRPHWEGIRPSETEERTMILFENLSDSGVVVEVNWIDFNGQEISYGWLEPGKSRFQPTYVGHPWVIRDSSTGEALLLFVTQNALGAAVVHPGHRVEYSYPL